MPVFIFLCGRLSVKEHNSIQTTTTTKKTRFCFFLLSCTMTGACFNKRPITARKTKEYSTNEKRVDLFSLLLWLLPLSMKQRNMEGQRETDRTGAGHDRTRQGKVDPMTIHSSDSTLVFHLHSDRRTHTQSNHVIDPSLLLPFTSASSPVSLDSLTLGVSVTNPSLFRSFRLLRIFSLRCVALRSLAKLVLYVSNVGPRKFAMRLFYFFSSYRLFPGKTWPANS